MKKSCNALPSAVFEKEKIESRRDLYEYFCNEERLKEGHIYSALIEILCGGEPFNGSFEEFTKYMQKNHQKATCGKSWTDNKLTIHCEECQKDRNSCVCLECFLNGHHEGHHASIRYSNNASCDCGDESLWKNEGFCHKHKGPSKDPDKTDFGEELRSTLITVFAIAFYYLPYLMEMHSEEAGAVLALLIKLERLGDGIRRCLCIALSQMCDVNRLVNGIFYIPPEIAILLNQLLSDISNDRIFREQASLKLVESLPSICEKSYELAKNLSQDIEDSQPWCKSLKILSKCIFHWFSAGFITYLRTNIKWIPLIIRITKLFIRFANEAPTKHILNQSRMSMIFASFEYIIDDLNDADEFKEFYAQFADCLVDFDFSRPFCRKYGEKEDDPTETGIITHSVSYIISQFTEKACNPEYFTPKVFDSMVKYLKKHDGELNWQCILDRDVPISFALDLHILISKQLIASGDSKKWIKYISDQTGKTLEQTCYDLSIAPCKAIAAYHLNNYNAFVRNSDSTRIALISFPFKSNLMIKFLPCFSLIQMCAEACPNKEQFMKNIASIFGVSPYTKQYDDDYSTVPSFFNFALNLALNRTCLKNSIEDVITEIISFLLRSEDMSYNDINHYLPYVKDNNTDIKILNSLSTKIKVGDRVLFRANSLAKWSFLLPWMSPGPVNSLVGSFEAKNKGMVFPLQIPEGHEDLLKILDTEIVRATVLSYIGSDNQIKLAFAYSYLCLCSQLHPATNGIKKEICFDDITLINEDLSCDFSTFIASNITINNKTVCIIDELKKTPLGKETLSKMGIEITTTDSEKEEKRRIMKQRAAAAKAKALMEMKASQNKVDFDDSIFEDIDKENEEERTCIVCQGNSNKTLYYQAVVYDTIVPSILNKEKHIRSTKVVNMCFHPVHKDCITSNRIGFNCPMDRSYKNILIPVFEPNVTHKIDLDQLPDIQVFIDRLCPHGQFTKLDSAIVLGSMLTILEAVDRNDPAYLDSPIQPLLYKILFSIFWSYKYDEDESTMFLPIIDDFCYQLLRSENPTLEFSSILKETYKKVPENMLMPFLRQVSILEMLVFVKERPRFFEWDQYLEYDSIINHFSLEKVPCTPLQPLNLFKLPESPIELYRPPFNEDVMRYDEEKQVFYCLLDGQIFGDARGLCPFREFNQRYQNAPIPLVILTGKYAMSFKINYSEFKFLFPVPSLYLDDLGQDSVGLRKLVYVKLNKERLLKLEKSFLTGEFLNIIRI